MWGWMALTTAVMAIASSPEQALNQAQLCISELDFSCAEAKLKQTRAQLDLLPAKDAKLALTLSAEVSLSLGRWKEAEEHLLALLILAPRFRPPQGAWQPKWLEAFQSARRRVPDQTPPQIKLQPVPSALVGAPLVISAQIVDPSGISKAALRVSDFPRTITMTSTAGDTFTGLIPAKLIKVGAFGVTVEAWDSYDNGPARVRAQVEIAPLPKASAAPPITSQWWFWTLLAAGVAGAAAGTTAIILANRPEPNPIIVRLQWP